MRKRPPTAPELTKAAGISGGRSDGAKALSVWRNNGLAVRASPTATRSTRGGARGKRASGTGLRLDLCIPREDPPTGRLLPQNREGAG
jgi:hypothetical protein